MAPFFIQYYFNIYSIYNQYYFNVDISGAIVWDRIKNNN